MMAIAIGPQNTEKASGTRARMAAAAVSRIGRARRTVASTIAAAGGLPALMSCSIWSTSMTLLRMMIPASAINPSVATKPNGAPLSSSEAGTPIRPSGAVSSTIATRPNDCSCTMSSASVTSTISGMTLLMLAAPFALSSMAPAVSIRCDFTQVCQSSVTSSMICAASTVCGTGW